MLFKNLPNVFTLIANGMRAAGVRPPKPRPKKSEAPAPEIHLDLSAGPHAGEAVWTYDGVWVWARTKSEARSRLKKILGPLPPGARVERAATA